MKISILVIGQNRQSAEDFMDLAARMLPKRLIPVDGMTPEFNLITTAVETVRKALEHGEEQPPDSFMKSDYRLMVASDRVADNFLCQMTEAMKQAYLGNEVKAEQLPDVITHSMAIHIISRACLLFGIQYLGMDPIEMLPYAVVIWVTRLVTIGSPPLLV